jgi:predicted metalloprotease with PDZ domain
MLKKHFLNRLLMLLSLALFASAAAAQPAQEINCRIGLSDRALDVRIEVPANRFEKTSFSLTDWGGQQNFADNVYRVTARDAGGNALSVEKTGARGWSVANAKKAFALSYTVVSQKDSFMGGGARNHFHPTLFKDYAFLWGSAFLFFPDEAEIAGIPVKLEIDPHEYGTAYSNFAGRAAAFSDLGDLFVAAGDYRVVSKNIGGRSVRFLLRGKNWKFTDEQFAATLSRIIEAQIKYLGFSPSNEDLLITLTEGAPGNGGGTVVKNVISVYPPAQAGLDDFETLKLIAHEHFHFWNGNYWQPAAGKKEGHYKWISEGFTEYYAGLTLYRENLISEKQFVGWLNRLLIDYQTNPHATTATAEILAEKYWESGDYNRLPYVKGALVAFLTDLSLRQKTGNKQQIDDLMRLLIAKTDRKKGYDDDLLLAGFGAVGRSGENAPLIFNRQIYDDYMLGAKFLPVAEVLPGSEIGVRKTPREVFELGFATETGRLERGARVKEVTSPAALEAGLKPGDELRGMSFSYGRPLEQASFTFARGGEIVPIKYYPKKTIELWQIDADAKIPR